MSHSDLPQPRPNLERYLVVAVATTCDEHGVYVTRDSAEVIELGWILLNAKNLEEIARDSVLVKPVNTPITPLCTSLTTIQYNDVRNAGDFRGGIQRITEFHHKYLGSEQLSLALVTLDAWDIRVQLPREARDKHVVLPPYLQHSKTFDLRTEYQRWQQYHPESLPFGASSLQNICAALEVEPVQNSAPIKHNLPFHLQALAPAAPRRAMDEAVTLTRVLIGLVRKSQPSRDHPDVLSRPLDMGADVNAFMKEQSRVLHMAGLQHDTTQSELESWFTQFGGRPIAFWTLKTPEQHKPTGTGFVVFSSHEEAVEMLCMNGRALNERAIEVSPSSQRVLNKASEILVPFPPSKNRPRPGDWTCPSCGFSNFQRRQQCFRCAYPASMGTAAPAPPQEGMNFSYGYQPHGMGGHQPMGHGPHGGGMRHMVPFRPGDWRCPEPSCQYHNFAKNLLCLRCGAPRNQAVQEPPPFPPQMDAPPSSAGVFAPSMASTPGPVPFGTPAGYATPGGFPGQQFGPPPNSFAVPSGMGPGPGGYAQMGFNPNSGPPSIGGFDQRTADAFSGAGPMASSNMQNSANGGANAQYDYSSGEDPFAFLTGPGGLSSLNIDTENRRNGPSNPNKSPS